MKPEVDEQRLDNAVQYHKAGDLNRAGSVYREILQRNPTHATALSHLGLLLYQTGAKEQALEMIERSLNVSPEVAETRNNYALVLHDLGRDHDAIAQYHKCIETKPDLLEPYSNLANVLRRHGNVNQAVSLYHHVLNLNPLFYDARLNLGVLLMEQGQPDEALQHFHRLEADRPGDSKLRFNLGVSYFDKHEFAVAIKHFAKAFEIDPHSAGALTYLIASKREICDWAGLTDLEAKLHQLVSNGVLHGIMPFQSLFLPSFATPERQAAVARAFVSRLPQRSDAPSFASRPKARPPKLRIAYLSADFHDHATSHLMLGLFARHDRRRFEVITYSYGPPSNDYYRRKIAADSDQFYDMRGQSYTETADHIRGHHVDILIDLKGYTTQARAQICAQRPAPLQVSYLGYPATMGADFIHYLLTDATVTSFEDAPHYTEKLVYLPGCYQINDREQAISSTAYTREQCNLPARGFVFCCFNNSFKIEPLVFDVWMRLLARTPDSVLWLLHTGESTEENLRHEARARGVSPDRLIFARKLPKSEHLARHRLADLFLDTLTYNAHTTASDALWTGVPVISLPGKTFAGRVATSLLRAMDLAELSVSTLIAYEQLALEIAHDTGYHRSLKSSVENNRVRSSLFDTNAFVGHLENAYDTMWCIYQDGDPPRSFSVW